MGCFSKNNENPGFSLPHFLQVDALLPYINKTKSIFCLIIQHLLHPKPCPISQLPPCLQESNAVTRHNSCSMLIKLQAGSRLQWGFEAVLRLPPGCFQTALKRCQWEFHVFSRRLLGVFGLIGHLDAASKPL